MPEPQTDVRTLADIPRWHARRRGEAVALIEGERTLSYAELDAESSRVARALLAAGVRPGTRVATLDTDALETFEIVFGTAKARGVLMGLNWRLAPPEIRYILDDGGVEVLFVGEDLFEKVAAIRDQLATVHTVVALSGTHDSWPAFDAWKGAHSADDPRLDDDPEDVVIQMYTSGTTGHPKGVQLANRSFFAVIRSMRAHGDPWIGLDDRDTSLLCFPSFHIGGLWWAMTGLTAGARNVVMDRFVGWKALDLLQRHQVTKTCMVPAMMQMILAEPDCRNADFSNLDHVVYGGSPIPLPLLKEAIATFGCRFAQIYGLTETGNTAVCLRPEDHDDPHSPRLRAAGRPYPGVRIKVVDSDGRVLPPHTVGEICIHSPANMVGYWNLPEATAATLVDGWIHTGDAGHVDDEGYVFVSDRVKDMIISAGENIYPAEIESVLCGHPAVAEAAVIGVPHDRWGELVKAIVVLKPGMTATAAEIIAHTRTELADFKVPRSVDCVEALPRTPSGKVRKGALREPYWKDRDRGVN